MPLIYKRDACALAGILRPRPYYQNLRGGASVPDLTTTVAVKWPMASNQAGRSFQMSIALTTKRALPAGGLILLTMSLGVLIAQIDTSVVNLAVKPIGADFKASVTALQWIVDTYNLVYASLLLSAGTLADLYGRRLIFALGIGLFTLGTLVCGLAPGVTTLVVGRAIAGLGAALEVPASLAILTIAYPDTRERTRALGIWASCYGIAMVIGPTAGGMLVDSSSWRSIFLLIVPFCAATLFLVLTSVPESSSRKAADSIFLGRDLQLLRSVASRLRRSKGRAGAGLRPQAWRRFPSRSWR